MSQISRTAPVFVALVTLLFSGCNTVQSAFRSGIPQEVTIDSVPSGADVYVAGDFLGTTPVTTKLPRKVTHEVVMEKDGYVVMRSFFNPTPNELGKSYVRFGLMEDLGLYVDLTPTDLVAQMSHTLIPMVKTAEPFKEMAYRVMLADALLDSGAITSDEHTAIYSGIVDFYTSN